MSCKKCGLDKFIVNKHFKLCQECNNLRLYGNKFGKVYKYTQKKRKPLKTNKTHIKSKAKERSESRRNKNIELDEIFYEKCFNNVTNHKCEECGEDLPTIFRNEDGKVVARWRYSHIIPKSIAPELRHSIININHLCLSDHQKWEFGDKKSMKIYKKNKKRLPKFF